MAQPGESSQAASAIEIAFGEHLDLRDAPAVADLLRQAAEANRAMSRRRGSVVDLPAEGTLFATGDLHDHVRNLRGIVKYAAPDQSPDRYLLLHEIVHGSSLVNGCDLSIRCLARVAALKVAYPEQVLLIQSNHELAQLNGEGIMKGGLDVIGAFEEGLDFLFGDEAPLVRAAFGDYVRSLPLAVRCANGVMCCHSLPGVRRLEGFDARVLDREPTDADLADRGAANELVWGRHHPQHVADALSEAWGCRVFVLGHQPAEMGWFEQGQTMLVLASDHEHGMLLPIDLAAEPTRDALIEKLVPINSISLEAGG